MTISDMFFPNSSSIFSSWKCFCTFLTGFVIDSVLSQKSWTASHKITNWTSKNSLFVFFFQFFSMRPIIIRGKKLISEQYSILQLLVPIFSRHVSWRHLFWIMHPTTISWMRYPKRSYLCICLWRTLGCLNALVQW